MRILFDSKDLFYKTPFGVLTPGQDCTLKIKIPQSCRTSAVCVCFESIDGRALTAFSFSPAGQEGAYELFSCTFRLSDCGLYFYYFLIEAGTGPFRLFRQGRQTNMEAGERWQLSCIPADFTVPDWMRGAVMYQIFPDRFYRSGSVELKEKLQPYILREDWGGQPYFRPNEQGEVLCNDFFGGNFRGICEKLPYLKQLGVSVVYLNPICMAFSNHRYDTADYKRPDPMLGTEEDFRALCAAAHEMGIRVILDGVFSHTGANSKYFNKYGNFEGGACSGPDSPYYSWYTFQHFPDQYTCWWDFPTLPDVNELDESYQNYILYDEDSVLAHWLRLGADGFRLDVVDELPDAFVSRLKKQLRRLRPDALLLGEVWEDASNKVSYGQLRRYFTDAQLDSTMNYPWRTAIIDFCKGLDDGAKLEGALLELQENYPPQVLACLMNPLGTHDTARILTVLAGEFDGDREYQSRLQLSAQQRALAKKRLYLASFLQFMLPGCPSIYYGDEAGMEGGKDPFNRGCFPWGQEDEDLQCWYRALSACKEQPAIKDGSLSVLQAAQGRLHLLREKDAQRIHILINRTEQPWQLCLKGSLLLARGLDAFSPQEITLGNHGFCAISEPQ